MSTADLVCEHCNNKVKEEDEYCPYCGSIFIDYIDCENHEDTPAAGVCLICSYAFCLECGKHYNNRFLCNEHSKYEIYETMVKVYGSCNSLEVEYIKNALIQEELHPVDFSRISPSSTDFSEYKPSGDFGNYIINEIKLMVPIQEVLKAEQIILDLKNDDEKE